MLDFLFAHPAAVKWVLAVGLGSYAVMKVCNLAIRILEQPAKLRAERDKRRAA
jgi:hypothetical protein